MMYEFVGKRKAENISGFLVQMMNVFNKMDARNQDILLAAYSLMDDSGILHKKNYQECKDLFGYSPDEIMEAEVQEKDIYLSTEYVEPLPCEKELFRLYLINKVSLEEMYDEILSCRPEMNLCWETILFLSMFFDTDTESYRKQVVQETFNFLNLCDCLS